MDKAFCNFCLQKCHLQKRNILIEANQICRNQRLCDLFLIITIRTCISNGKKKNMHLIFIFYTCLDMPILKTIIIRKKKKKTELTCVKWLFNLTRLEPVFFPSGVEGNFWLSWLANQQFLLFFEVFISGGKYHLSP